MANVEDDIARIITTAEKCKFKKTKAGYMKKFQPLICSTYIFSCALPLNLDSYRYCPYQCEYCFMKNRVIGAFDKRNNEPNIRWLRNKFKKVYDEHKINETNLIDVMLDKRIDLHFGTKSEPFQPLEKEKHYTREIVDLCNEYDCNIIFTTKSDTTHDVDLDPDKHCIQMSVTNHYDDRFLEPNVPPFERRVEFYNRLKDEGFKVGLRFEPFIPNVTDVPTCLEYFEEPDIVHIAKLNLLPQTNHDELIRYIGCSKKQFTTHGKTHMKLDLLYEQYLKDVFRYLKENGYSYSARTASIGNNNCCCGDTLVHKSNTFDPVHLYRKYGGAWTCEDALYEMGSIRNCNCSSLYTSNRRGNLKTCEEFFRDRWNKPTSKFNPHYSKMERDKTTQTTLNTFIRIGDKT